VINLVIVTSRFLGYKRALYRATGYSAWSTRWCYRRGSTISGSRGRKWAGIYEVPPTPWNWREKIGYGTFTPRDGPPEKHPYRVHSRLNAPPTQPLYLPEIGGCTYLRSLRLWPKKKHTDLTESLWRANTMGKLAPKGGVS
jgi:hypothetical protein